MKNNKLKIIINRPVDEVFEFTINPQNTHLWVPSIAEEIAEEYPPRVGTKYKNRGNGSDWLYYEFMAFEKNKTFTLADSDHNYFVRYIFTEIADGQTEIDYLEWVESGNLKDPLQTDALESLKNELEKNFSKLCQPMEKGVDYIGVGAGAIVFNSEGKVFIAQRGPDSRNEAGKWDFPGGSVDFGETCASAVIRELKEEFEIDIEIIEFLEVVDHILPEENQHWVSPSFVAKHVNGDPRITEPEKCIGFKWVDMSEIDPNDLSVSSKSNYQKFIEKYGNKKTFF